MSVLSNTQEKISFPGNYSGYSKKKYKKVERTSFYLPMRDGVKLAINLNLPRGMEPGKKIPAIIYQTRYVRSIEYRWPFSLFKDNIDEMTRYFVSHGYAYIEVDVRGAGASFGTRICPWSPDETKDGNEVVNWIIKQPWSNEKVGTIGISYSGTAAEMLLANRHSAVKVAAIDFSLFDAYDDIVFPGGIYSFSFVKDWGKANSILDRNAWGELGFLALIAAKGVMPVDEDKNRSMLARASKMHLKNIDVHKEALGITFRDDIAPSGFGTLDFLSPHTYIEDIKQSKTPIYSRSGWFDGAYVHSVIKRYLTFRDTNPFKLIIGPWDHDTFTWVSPWKKEQHADFSDVQEYHRILDYHLKGVKNGLDNEKPVHYFTMGEEKWKSADTWPLPEQRMTAFYLAAGAKLLKTAPNNESGFDTYQVDYSAGTGKTSRWESLLRDDYHQDPTQYPDRREEDKKLLVYDSDVLPDAVEVTGHPLVKLYLSSNQTDGYFIVYLEDIDPSGKVIYVTEGGLRGIHRKISDEKPLYSDVVPYRTYKKKDAMPLIPGEKAELVFDLLPTSYCFQKGHRIRVAIAGADQDHFSVKDPQPQARLKVYRNRITASLIELPIIPEYSNSNNIKF